MKLYNYVRGVTHVLTVICFFLIVSAMCAEIEVGNELPVFGKRYTDNPLDIDAMYERMAVWYHPCVERTPIREVSKKEIRKWLQKRINYRRMGVDNKAHAGREYLSRIEMLLAETCAEMYRYGLRYNASEPIEMINGFYNTNNYHYYWEGKMPTWEFKEIIKYCEACFDRLDRIHEKEYEAWAKNNPEEWSARNKAKIERERREAVARKFEELEERTRAAER